MPSKNTRKSYVQNGYYHIYNRGVEKRIILSDEQDYAVYLKYLKDYLEPKNDKDLFTKLSDKNVKWDEKDKILKLLKLNNFSGEIELLAYCLMPNHFHLLIKQNKPESMDKFANSLLTRYVMYFNRKNSRVGPLFQGVYKAVLVESEEQLLHLSRYIHRNPLELKHYADDHQKRYTSLPEYLSKRKTSWVNPKPILSYFSKENQKDSCSYLSFVKEDASWEMINQLAID